MKVISGGQTGADIGGVRAAKDAGLPTGGWMPKGFLTEDGCKPERAYFGFKETDSTDYRIRTYRNVIDSDITLWFGNAGSRGGIATHRACISYNRQFVKADEKTDSEIKSMLLRAGVGVVNIAGNRESKSPGIEGAVYRRLAAIFSEMQQGGRL